MRERQIWKIPFFVCTPVFLLFGLFIGRTWRSTHRAYWEGRMTEAEGRCQQAEAKLADHVDESRSELAEVEGQVERWKKVAQEINVEKRQALARAEKDLGQLEKKMQEARREHEQRTTKTLRRTKELERKLVALQARAARQSGPDQPEKATGPVALSFKPAEIKDAQGRIAYAEIRKNEQTLTDAQWEDYGRHILGSEVKWTGWVAEAGKQFSGEQYLISVDMDPPDGSPSVPDVQVKVPRATAQRFKKGQKIVFWGTIHDVAAFLDKHTIYLDEATVVLYKKGR